MTNPEIAVLRALMGMEDSATIRQVQKAVGCYVFSYIATTLRLLEAEGLIEPREIYERKAIRISEEGRVSLSNIG